MRTLFNRKGKTADDLSGLNRRERRELKDKERIKDASKKSLASLGVFSLLSISVMGTAAQWDRETAEIDGNFSSGSVSDLQISTDEGNSWDPADAGTARFALDTFTDEGGVVLPNDSFEENVQLRFDGGGYFDAELDEFEGFDFTVDGETVSPDASVSGNSASGVSYSSDSGASYGGSASASSAVSTETVSSVSTQSEEVQWVGSVKPYSVDLYDVPDALGYDAEVISTIYRGDEVEVLEADILVDVNERGRYYHRVRVGDDIGYIYNTMLDNRPHSVIDDDVYALGDREGAVGVVHLSAAAFEGMFLSGPDDRDIPANAYYYITDFEYQPTYTAATNRHPDGIAGFTVSINGEEYSIEHSAGVESSEDWAEGHNRLVGLFDEPLGDYEDRWDYVNQQSIEGFFYAEEDTVVSRVPESSGNSGDLFAGQEVPYVDVVQSTDGSGSYYEIVLNDMGDTGYVHQEQLETCPAPSENIEDMVIFGNPEDAVGVAEYTKSSTSDPNFLQHRGFPHSDPSDIMWNGLYDCVLFFVDDFNYEDPTTGETSYKVSDNSPGWDRWVEAGLLEVVANFNEPIDYYDQWAEFEDGLEGVIYTSQGYFSYGLESPNNETLQDIMAAHNQGGGENIQDHPAVNFHAWAEMEYPVIQTVEVGGETWHEVLIRETGSTTYIQQDEDLTFEEFPTDDGGDDGDDGIGGPVQPEPSPTDPLVSVELEHTETGWTHTSDLLVDESGQYSVDTSTSGAYESIRLMADGTPEEFDVHIQITDYAPLNTEFVIGGGFTANAAVPEGTDFRDPEGNGIGA